MKRFIRYLYEYEQGRRKRNVGFVKVEQDEEECTLHIHGKGLRIESGSSFRVYLFYVDGENCIGVFQGEIGYMGPALNYRLRYTAEDVGVPQNYEKVNGVLLEGSGSHKFAALWDETLTDIEKLQLRQGESREAAQEQKPARSENAARPEDMERGADLSEQPAVQIPGEADERLSHEMCGDMPEPEAGADDIGQIDNTGEADDIDRIDCGDNVSRSDDADVMEGAGDADDIGHADDINRGDDVRDADNVRDTDCVSHADGAGTPVWKVTKLQRKDITMLPRCEWRLANNNFLLHGYYNYRHLVLLDNGTVLKLGVPGIYHEKEARAAEGFGFPEFINAKETKLSLKPEECNKEELFGYWCRQVRRRSM